MFRAESEGLRTCRPLPATHRLPQSCRCQGWGRRLVELQRLRKAAGADVLGLELEVLMSESLLLLLL